MTDNTSDKYKGHTQGPWRQNDGPGDYDTGIINADGIRVAYAEGGGGYPYICTPNEKDCVLMMDAPTLLQQNIRMREALEKIAEIDVHDTSCLMSMPPQNAASYGSINLARRALSEVDK